MLTSFTWKRTFNLLRVSLYVDVESQAADVTITYDRRLRVIDGVPYYKVATPEKASAFFGQQMGERGSLIEILEYEYRVGIRT